MAPRIVVVGAGSVGRRHLRNLAGLGCELIAVDPRADRLAEAATEVDLTAAADRLDANLLEGAAGLVVASPPKFHVEQASLGLSQGLAVLLEKPVSHDLGEARSLAQVAGAQERLLVGYSYRWWPAIQELRSLLAQGAVGRPLHASCSMAAHLADWHPWERYQDFFMASAELGGGALLDESHVIDLMLWFFGLPASVTASVDRLSDLEIDSDDNVDMVWRAPDGPQVVIHLDLYSRPHDRSITVRGSEGSAVWTFHPNQVAVYREEEVDLRAFDTDRNEMFVAEAAELLRVIDGERPSCGIADGVDALRVVDAARRASEQGSSVAVAAG